MGLIRALLLVILFVTPSAWSKNENATEFIQLTADSVEVIRVEIVEDQVFWEELRDSQFQKETYRIQSLTPLTEEQKKAFSILTRVSITAGISVVATADNGNSMHFLIGDGSSGHRHLALQAMPEDYGETRGRLSSTRSIELVSLGATTLKASCAASLVTAPRSLRRLN